MRRHTVSTVPAARRTGTLQLLVIDDVAMEQHALRATAIDPAARAGVRQLRSELPGDVTTGKQLLAARVTAAITARRQTSESVTVTRHPVV